MKSNKKKFTSILQLTSRTATVTAAPIETRRCFPPLKTELFSLDAN